MRADLVVAQEFNISRNKAAELIKNAQVVQDGVVVKSPSCNLVSNSNLSLLGEVFVSRAALKLQDFLAHSELRVGGKRALDVGASKGGFTQILLQNWVKSVVAVDVGTMQFDEKLRLDERLEVREQCDIREFESAPFELVVADVSFISLNLILPHLVRLCCGELVVLFKPQFEVGKEAKRDKLGVVKDQRAVVRVMDLFEVNALKSNLILRQKRQCGVAGKNGNVEWFYWFSRVGEEDE